MPLSLQNNLLDLHRHHFIFRHSRPFRLDCQDDLYSHFQHSERGHRLRSSMVVSPPYGITTRLDWPRLNSGVFMSGKKTIVTLLRVPDLHPSTVVALNRRSLQEVFSNDKFRVRRGREALSALMQNRLAVEDKFRSFRPADFADVFRRYPPSGRSPLREKMNGIALILTPDSFIKKEYVD
ncbi:TPA: hypothetical protein ACNE63_004168 [Escherichia coli]